MTAPFIGIHSDRDLALGGAIFGSVVGGTVTITRDGITTSVPPASVPPGYQALDGDELAARIIARVDSALASAASRSQTNGSRAFFSAGGTVSIGGIATAGDLTIVDGVVITDGTSPTPTRERVTLVPDRTSPSQPPRRSFICCSSAGGIMTDGDIINGVAVPRERAPAQPNLISRICSAIHAFFFPARNVPVESTPLLPPGPATTAATLPVATTATTAVDTERLAGRIPLTVTFPSLATRESLVVCGRGGELNNWNIRRALTPVDGTTDQYSISLSGDITEYKIILVTPDGKDHWLIGDNLIMAPYSAVRSWEGESLSYVRTNFEGF